MALALAAALCPAGGGAGAGDDSSWIQALSSADPSQRDAAERRLVSLASDPKRLRAVLAAALDARQAPEAWLRVYRLLVDHPACCAALVEVANDGNDALADAASACLVDLLRGEISRRSPPIPPPGDLSAGDLRVFAPGVVTGAWLPVDGEIGLGDWVEWMDASLPTRRPLRMDPRIAPSDFPPVAPHELLLCPAESMLVRVLSPRGLAVIDLGVCFAVTSRDEAEEFERIRGERRRRIPERLRAEVEKWNERRIDDRLRAEWLARRIVARPGVDRDLAIRLFQAIAPHGSRHAAFSDSEAALLRAEHSRPFRRALLEDWVRAGRGSAGDAVLHALRAQDERVVELGCRGAVALRLEETLPELLSLADGSESARKRGAAVLALAALSPREPALPRWLEVAFRDGVVRERLAEAIESALTVSHSVAPLDPRPFLDSPDALARALGCALLARGGSEAPADADPLALAVHAIVRTAHPGSRSLEQGRAGRMAARLREGGQRAAAAIVRAEAVPPDLPAGRWRAMVEEAIASDSPEAVDALLLVTTLDLLDDQSWRAGMLAPYLARTDAGAAARAREAELRRSLWAERRGWFIVWLDPALRVF